MRNLTTFILFTALSTSMVFAQSNATVVKILPHNEKHVVRLMYVGNPSSAVKVTFKQNGKTLKTDVIRSSRFKKGFIKLYDVAYLKDGNYTVEVESDDQTSTCPFIVAEHEQLWAQFWNEQLNNNTAIVGIQKTDSIIKTVEN